jgi:hypothetical protein
MLRAAISQVSNSEVMQQEYGQALFNLHDTQAYFQSLMLGAVYLLLLQVSNSELTQLEYDKALAKAQRGHSKFITKGDVQQAQERLQHARK